ncbi:EamA family transporter [Curtobacterium sp. MCBA15_013]|uniref:EamA family transporter n=1 Tax=Curtobacterium sp. MCBA15_013 TaxID=1898739 RepID=UPI0008DC707B|nr:EamA family transporter [Curtobacterium sp. MCBA15_013]OII22252.1 hypothetical protein BIV01_17385 [Curtobacterium sp. MCBA15_013]
MAIGSSPVFAGLVEWVADGRRVTRKWVVATLVSVVGMVVVTLARSSEHAGASGGSDRGGTLVLGLGSALLAGLTYALYSWAVARGMRAVSVPVALPGGVSVADRASLLARGSLPARASMPARASLPGRASPPARASLPGERGLVGAVFGLAAVPLVVLAVVGGQASLGVAANWPVFLYLALVPTVLGHSLYAVGLRSVSASVATLLSLFEPVVAAVLAVLVVGEHLGAGGWVGIGLVVVGLAVLAVPERTRA